MRRTLIFIRLVAAALLMTLAGASTAQVRGGPVTRQQQEGVAPSIQFERYVPGGNGLSNQVRPDGSKVIVSPRHVTANLKDHVVIQNRVRRRWDAAGPEERQHMLDVQRQLHTVDAKSIGEVEQQELRDRQTSRARMPRAVSESSSGEGVPLVASGSGMSNDDRRILRDRLRDMSPGQRQVVRDRMSELRSMDPMDQAILREQLQQWMSLSEADRNQIDGYRQRWEGMTPEEQDAMRRRMLRLREMTSEDRNELLNRALGDRPVETAP